MKSLGKIFGITAGLLVLPLPPHHPLSGQSPDPSWATDWVAEAGFSLEVDVGGFSLPTAIAFVPEPGTGPADPLYFVTELRGRILVVTNDRSVHTFAETFVDLRPTQELPAEAGEIGVAGICLAPEQGYVYVTFPFADEEGVLRNDIIRFESTPGTFGLRPSDQVSFSRIFAEDRSSRSHQIGPCQIDDGLLYVSVGDGMQMYESRNLDSTLGKILRMTLDGEPAQGNPFYDPGNPSGARDYVWAYGLRNPFSLKTVGGRVFVADNGLAVDRFFEAQAGQDYLWDGTDWSIATNSGAVLVPAPAPVQMDYLPAEGEVLPQEYRGSFFLAMAGLPAARGPADRPGAKGVVKIPFDMATGRVTGAPRTLLQYRGPDHQSVVGLAIGPDGLYVAPLLPFPDGDTPILRIRYRPEEAHPYLATDHVHPARLMGDRGCFGCHSLDPEITTVGPALDSEGLVARLGQWLHSPGYEAIIRSPDLIQDDPLRHHADLRQRLLRADGIERIRLGIKAKILEPRYDDPEAAMPDLGLSRGEAAMIADFLLGLDQGPPTLRSRIRGALQRLFPGPGYRHLGITFVAGFALPWILLLGLILARRRRSSGEQ